MCKIRDDQPTSRKLKIDMAAPINGMEPFVRAIYVYFLEGDGPMHYTHMNALLNFF